MFGSDQYQVRLSYGETVVRPDLREVADVTYIDPDLDVRVRGNPALVSSPIDNFEIRSEPFYWSGDNFTVSLREVEQVNSTGEISRIIDQEVGTSFSLSGRWFF